MLTTLYQSVLIPGAVVSLQFICDEGTVFTLKTDLDAPRYRLVNIDITKPDKVRYL